MNNIKSVSDTPFEPPALNILYEDDSLVAVCKPEGLLVHKSNIDKHETVFLLQQLRDQIGCYIYPVHRLDKPTSGVIIFAKSPEVAAAIKLQMENNCAIKEYLLLCRGYCPESGRIDHPLKPIVDFKNKRGKAQAQKPAQEAVTDFERLATIEITAAIDKYPTSRFSLVKARLQTGRKHQIRRHFKHLSHPIIGCPKYGKSKYNHYFAQHFGAGRLLLHAYRLVLEHPVTGEKLVFCAHLEGAFLSVVERFGWLEVIASPSKDLSDSALQ